MADGLELNAGSGGATLATDDAGAAGHVQVVKLAVSADGSATPITADAGGLLVNLGANNDVTVTGTVDLGATDNAVLDAIAASVAGTLTVDGSGVTQPISAASLPLPTGASTSAKQDTIIGHLDGVEGLLTTIDGDTGTLAVVGGGTEAAALRVTLASDSTGVVSVDDNGGSLTVDNAGLTELAAAIDTEVQCDIVGALPAGTNAIGKLAANSGVDIGDVDVTSIAAGTNAIGNVGLVPRTTGGMTIFRSIDIDESEEEIKSSAGQIFSISAFNTTAAPLYLKFYNATAANVSVGTTTPVLTFVVPGNADSDGAGFIWNNDIGFAFGTAISVACTTGVADADTGAPGANACIINIGYA